MNVVTREDRLLREARRAAERRRRTRMVGLGVSIPALIALIYYAFIARPEYETVMKFTEQGVSAPVTSDFLTGLGIPQTSGQTNDGRIIVDYIQSAGMVQKLRKEYGFDSAYRGPTLDPVGYIPRHSTVTDDENFWTSQVTASYDSSSNVVEVHVLAFRPEDSLRLAQGVLSETQALVNSLNSKVRDESIRVAQKELDARAADYAKARDRVVQARSGNALTVDAQVQAQVAELGNIDAQIASAQVDRAGQQATFQANSPQMKAADEKLAALQNERARLLGSITGGPGQPTANRDIGTQAALLDYETAQKAYYTAQAGLQQAISTRENQRRYLVAYMPPTLPEASNYWNKFSNVLAVALFSALLMGVGALSYSVVKDHLQ